MAMLYIRGMSLKQRAVKMPDELWAAIQEKAGQMGLSAGEYVRQTMEQEVEQGLYIRGQEPDISPVPFETELPEIPCTMYGCMGVMVYRSDGDHECMRCIQCRSEEPMTVLL